ncbi:hypothetical protein [Porcipelethomonas sp.]|uniref:hypothetical protein n=1 Tax=Porcipelethomonas sp. TaxID=2981675 RepID=UPI003EF9332C
MNNISYKVALGGVISSLCLLAMFMAGVAPFLYLTLPMIAGALISIMVVEVNTSWAFLTYAAVSLLSIFVTYDKESALIFILFFGHYPIIKHKIEKIHFKPLKFSVKIVIFNICIVLYYQLTLRLLGIEDYADDFASLGKYGIYILWILSNFIFVVYDYALSGCIDMYIKYLKPKIFGSKKK